MNDRLDRVRIPEGFGDVQAVLGAEKAVFTTGFITDPEDTEGGQKLPTPEPEGDVYLNQLGAVLAGKGATVATLGLDPAHRAYLEDLGLLQGTILEGQHPNELRYPEASVEAQLLSEISRGNQQVRECLNGTLFAPAFPTQVAQEVAALSGGRTLMSPEQSVSFNSKRRLRESAPGRYLIPEGVEISSLSELSAKIRQLKERFSSVSNLKLWVKFDSLSGGDGVFPFYPQPGSLDALIKKLDHVARQSHFYNGLDPRASLSDRLDAILKIMPIVIEVDIASHPETETVLANYNVQAILTDQGPRLVDGTSAQITHEGTYLGNARHLSGAALTHQARAEQCFMDACQMAWEEGCRGYVGGDVIVRLTKDGRPEAIIFDFNGRPNASTFFVRSHHYFEREAGRTFAALNTNLRFPTGVSFAEAAEQLQGELFRGKSSGFTGVMPAALRSLPDRPNPVMKTAIFAPTIGGIQEIKSSLAARGIQS